jgi:hypothetical protein
LNVYVDESGDLGFTFKPHGRGSSRYLTIACLITPKELSKHPKRLVKKFYSKLGQSPRHELKAADLTPSDKIYFSEQARKLLNKYPRIKIISMTVKKTKVQGHIRQDPNKLYNYMLGLLLPNRIKRYPLVTLIPDERSVKVKSGNSLIDYLQIKLWFEFKAKTTLEYYPVESSRVLNVQFIDYVCNIIWNHYERNHDGPYNILKNKIISIPLFFS